MLESLTIGADPELFLRQGDKWKSAIGLVGGSKYAPRALGDREGYFIQEDNVAIEFNIPPAKSLQEFCDSISYSWSEITREVNRIGMTPVAAAAAFFPPEELEDERALVFGCDPDFNAWKNGRRNPRPRSSNEYLRSCGGHVHVGYPSDAKLDKLRAVQLMDLYLGVPSVMMDQDQTRRKLYGKAGAFRNTTYGFEYRTLSNFWLTDPKLVEWTYTQTVRAMNRAVQFGLQMDKGPDEYTEFMERHDLADDIVKCINKGDVLLSHKLITLYDLDVR
jgi:phiEco32-like amidoligase-type 2 protein